MKQVTAYKTNAGTLHETAVEALDSEGRAAILQLIERRAETKDSVVKEDPVAVAEWIMKNREALANILHAADPTAPQPA